MYKVFFKDRIVFFSNDFPDSLKSSEGLYYKYDTRKALKKVIKAYFDLDSVKELHLIHDDLEELWKVFKSVFKIIKAGGGLVMNEKGEVLFIKRNGLWDLPKGKAEKDETIKNTALREVKEECGMNKIKLKSHITSSYHIYILNKKRILKKTEWYEMYSSSKENLCPQTSENITDVIWIKPDEISYITGNTYSSITEVLKKAKLI